MQYLHQVLNTSIALQYLKFTRTVSKRLMNSIVFLGSILISSLAYEVFPTFHPTLLPSSQTILHAPVEKKQTGHKSTHTRLHPCTYSHCLSHTHGKLPLLQSYNFMITFRPF
mmetsp:Transcript_17809/g.24873  ORF Transcript_17809/g.24873 Transcript_17809/m.24873 type:complete len:112 (+) Transcript_17809:85-420(+)